MNNEKCKMINLNILSLFITPWRAVLYVIGNRAWSPLNKRRGAGLDWKCSWHGATHEAIRKAVPTKCAGERAAALPCAMFCFNQPSGSSLQVSAFELTCLQENDWAQITTVRGCKGCERSTLGRPFQALRQRLPERHTQAGSHLGETSGGKLPRLRRARRTMLRHMLPLGAQRRVP